MMPTVKGFEVLKRLGGGSVAEVFLVRSEMSQQQLVMKVLRPELLADATAVGRFLDEAKLCEALDHPHVVRHLGVSRTPEGGLYLLTRFLEGQDLARHLREHGPLTAEQWVRLARPLCEALDYIHQRGVVHRDLKPSNVFLVGGLEAYRPMLIDFGVARFDGPRRAKTGEGVVLTTPEYVAPELIDGGAPDARSDIYALGVMMFECLVGHPPFSDPSPARLFQMHREDSPGPLPTEAAGLEPVMQRCMARRPEDRFQSARAVATALEEAPTLDDEGGARTMHPPLTGPPAPAGMEVGPGTMLGNYRVERLLGEGGMGRVFLATHQRLGRNAAIKVLKPEHSGRKDVVERFFHEARSVNQINHEHIVEVHDFIEDKAPDGSPRAYCIMELLSGRTLGAALGEGPLPLRRTLGIFRQICDALGAAHRLGIVHRDVKPENIFLIERSGVQDFVKVLDFGMAKFLAPLGDLPSASTLQGLIIGTPDYMAPEQVQGQATDARTDLYAVGLVLYEMLSGRVPFEAATMMLLFMKICNDAPAPLGTTTASGEPIPAPLAAIVMRCLEKAPGDRPSDMAQLLQALPAPAAGTAPDPQPAPAAASVQRRPRRRRVVLALGLALGVAAPAGFFAWKAWSLNRALTSELALADLRIEQLHLAGPGGDAALDHLLAAQKLASGDERVNQRLREVADLFEQLGDRALQRGDRAEAAAHFQAALLAVPHREEVTRKLQGLQAGIRNAPHSQPVGGP